MTQIKALLDRMSHFYIMGKQHPTKYDRGRLICIVPVTDGYVVVVDGDAQPVCVDMKAAIVIVNGILDPGDSRPNPAICE